MIVLPSKYLIVYFIKNKTSYLIDELIFHRCPASISSLPIDEPNSNTEKTNDPEAVSLSSNNDVFPMFFDDEEVESVVSEGHESSLTTEEDFQEDESSYCTGFY